VVGKALHPFCDGILEIPCEMRGLANILMEKGLNYDNIPKIMKCVGTKEWNVIFVDSIYCTKLLYPITTANPEIPCLKA